MTKAIKWGRLAAVLRNIAGNDDSLEQKARDVLLCKPLQDVYRKCRIDFANLPNLDDFSAHSYRKCRVDFTGLPNLDDFSAAIVFVATIHFVHPKWGVFLRPNLVIYGVLPYSTVLYHTIAASIHIAP